MAQSIKLAIEWLHIACASYLKDGNQEYALECTRRIFKMELGHQITIPNASSVEGLSIVNERL